MASGPAVLDALVIAGAEWEAMQRAPQRVTRSSLWTPLPGPQTAALETPADELFYGGSAGSGKSDLVLGLALSRHKDAVVFRREYKQLRALVERSRSIVGQHGRFNGTEYLWRLDGDRILEFGAVEHEHDKYKWQGRPHDLKAFDEIAQFTESQFRFLIGWNRSTVPGQRSRVVCAGNPPTGAEGEWVIQYWAPWLDPQHPNPAEPGALRWFAQIEGKDVECEDGTPFEHKGETIHPRSRTFIPARLEDNPYLATTGYRAVLQGMPEPLRSQMLYGDFTIGLADDAWQVIPTAWVRAAQDRWTEDGRPTLTNAQGRTYPRPLDQAGVDVAEGGSNRTVVARRYGTWFAEPEDYPGRDTPNPQVTADLILQTVAQGGRALVDVDGLGGKSYGIAYAQQPGRVYPYAGSAPTDATDSSGELRFVNTRAAAWWHFRELLDPTNDEPIALPPSRELRVELCAPRWETQANGIKIERKEKIIERLGRSPDQADAVVMAAWDDPAIWLAQAFAAVSDPGKAPDPENDAWQAEFKERDKRRALREDDVEPDEDDAQLREAWGNGW